MSKEKHPMMVDFDATEVDDQCGMRYWWSQQEGGGGIIHTDRMVETLLQKELKADVRAFADLPKGTVLSGKEIQGLIDAALEKLTGDDKTDQIKMELLYRRLGMMAAFAYYIEHSWRLDLEPVPLDEELLWEASDALWVVVHTGRLFKSRHSDCLIYRDFVSMPPTHNIRGWLQSWHYKMREHVALAAVNNNLSKEPFVDHASVVGMAEGYRSAIDGRLVHPYVWGYYNAQRKEWAHTFKPTGADQTWALRPVWEYPDGLLAWVQFCGKHTADQQFMLSPPVHLNKTMLDHWVTARTRRERLIDSAASKAHENRMLRVVAFPQQTTQCQPAMGPACAYLTACWNPMVWHDPLKSGAYVPMPGKVKEAEVMAEVVAEDVII